jgi:hypothetical protein
MGEMRQFMTFPARETLATAAERRLNWAAFARIRIQLDGGAGPAEYGPTEPPMSRKPELCPTATHRRRERRS